MLTDERIDAMCPKEWPKRPGRLFARQIEAQCREEFCDEIVGLKLDVAGLVDKKFARFGNEDCWLYQGDGSDDLDSLVCPAVVKPQMLSGILDTVSEQAERIAELEAELAITDAVQRKRIAELEKRDKQMEKRLKAYQQAWDAKDLHKQMSEIVFQENHGVSFEKIYQCQTIRIAELERKNAELSATVRSMMDNGNE